jgi:indole-3-glycerol phosphate synthase
LRRYKKIKGVGINMEGILKKLFDNSKKAISDGVYNIEESLSNSGKDLIKIINDNQHASLITEVKFSSPSLGEIKKISDPIVIAKSMVSGGAKALSILTQPYLFSGSPDFFIKIRKEIDVPLLMKDIRCS